MSNDYKGGERRKFIRLDYTAPLAYKVCKEETITKLLEGYTTDVSETGLLCKINQKVASGDILWLSFDRSTLNICTEMDSKCLIYQNGIIGKVVRIEQGSGDSFQVGVKFLTREEKNQSYIYPKIYFNHDNTETVEKNEEA